MSTSLEDAFHVDTKSSRGMTMDLGGKLSDPSVRLALAILWRSGCDAMGVTAKNGRPCIAFSARWQMYRISENPSASKHRLTHASQRLFVACG